jgi:amphiphysin
MAGHIAELADGEIAGAPSLPDGADGPGSAAAAAAAAQSREQVAARAHQLVAMMEQLEMDVRPACAEQLRSAVTQPVAQLCEEFPAYKPCVDKRRTYMLDMDAYERKLEHTRTHTKDPGQIPHREEQRSRATRRFTYFNDKLVEDLTLLDNNRFELAGFLIEGFVETQEFEVNRKRDVYAAMQEGKLPRRAD